MRHGSARAAMTDGLVPGHSDMAPGHVRGLFGVAADM